MEKEEMNVEATTDVGVETEQKPMSFDELINSNKDYQSAFDKKVSDALKTAKGKWEADYSAKIEAERTEAEKIANMNAEQKLKYEVEKAKEEARISSSKLNAYELKEQATRIAREKGLDTSLLDVLDFGKEDADTVLKKIDLIKSNYDKAIEKAVNDKLRQSTPEQRKTSVKRIDPYIEGFVSEFYN